MAIVNLCTKHRQTREFVGNGETELLAFFGLLVKKQHCSSVPQ